MNMELIRRLQFDVAPNIFTPRAVYDGRKNLFSIRELPFGDEGTREVYFLYFNIILFDLRKPSLTYL